MRPAPHMRTCVALACLLLAACATKPLSDAPIAEPSSGASIDPTDGSDGAAPPASPSSAPVATAAPSDGDRPDPRWIELSPRVRVERAARVVEFDALAVLDTGFLEQYICTEGTREHESLFVFEGKASEVHAALLLAGFEAGSPGSWREVAAPAAEGPDASGWPPEKRLGTSPDANPDASPETSPETRFEGIPPRGSTLSISVRLPDGAERPLTWFVRAAPLGEAASPSEPPGSRHGFVFGGSRFHRDRRTGIERYVADGSGSLVGLVTFGDETIGPGEVVPDQASVATPMWEVRHERMPPLGTRVAIVVRAPTHGVRSASPTQEPAR